MAVMGVAALVGAGAVSAGASIAVVAWVGVAAAVVGMATKNPTLSKIGAGLSLGAGGAGLAELGAPAATSAEVMSGAAASDAGSLGGAGAAVDANAAGGAAAAASDAGNGMGALGTSTVADAGGAAAASDAGSLGALQPEAVTAGNPIAPEMADYGGAAAPAPVAQPTPMQAPGLDGPAATPAGASPSGSTGVASTGGQAPTVQSPTAATDPNSIQAQNDAASAGQASDAGNGMTPQQQLAKNTNLGLTNSKQWFEQLWDGLGNMKGGQQTMLGQTIAGVGKGAASYISDRKKYDYLENERDYQRANNSAAGMPTLNLRPKGLLASQKG